MEWVNEILGSTISTLWTSVVVKWEENPGLLIKGKSWVPLGEYPRYIQHNPTYTTYIWVIMVVFEATWGNILGTPATRQNGTLNTYSISVHVNQPSQTVFPKSPRLWASQLIDWFPLMWTAFTLQELPILNKEVRVKYQRSRWLVNDVTFDRSHGMRVW